MLCRFCGWLFAASLAFIPLFYILDIQEQTELPKRCGALLVTGIVWILWLIGVSKASSDQTPRIWFPRTAWCLGGFAIWQLVTAPFAWSPTQSLDNVLVAFETFLWFLLACQILRDPCWRPRVVVALCVSGLVAAIVGLFQYGAENPGTFPFGRLDGLLEQWGRGEILGGVFAGVAQTDSPGSVFGHTNLAAQFVGIAIPILGLLALRRLSEALVWDNARGFLRSLPWFLPPAILGLFVLRSGSRGVLLALTVSAGVGWAVYFSRSLWLKPILGSRFLHVLTHALLVAVMTLGAINLLSGIQVQPRFGQEATDSWTRLMSAADSRNTTVRERRDLWANTLEMIGDNPVFGVGPGNYRVAYPQYSHVRARHELGRLTLRRQPEKAHNSYLNVLAENGWVGGGLWILAVCGVALAGLTYSFSRRGFGSVQKDLLVLGAALSVVFILCTAVVSFPFMGTGTRIAFWSLAAMLLAAAKDSGRHEFPLSPFRAMVGSAAILLFILALAPYYRSRIEGSRMVSIAGWVRGEALDIHGDENRFLLWELRHLDSASARVPTNYRYELYRAEVLRRLGRLSESQQSYQKTLALHPNLVNAWIGLSSAYLIGGRAEDARRAAETAVRMNPSEPEAHVALANTFDLVGNKQRAIGSYRAAVLRRPQVSTLVRVHVNLAMLFAETNNALAGWYHVLQAENLAGNDPVVLEAKARVLERQAPGSKRAVHAWSAVIQSNPRHAEALLHLGNALMRENQFEEALSFFEDAYRANRWMRVSLFRRAEALLKLDRFAEARDSVFECMKECAKFGSTKLWERCRLLAARIEEGYRARGGGDR